MSDALRDKIAAALRARDEAATPGIDPYDDLADAVIRELGWRREWSISRLDTDFNPPRTAIWETTSGYIRTFEDRDRECVAEAAAAQAADYPEDQPQVVVRYVTSWEPE